MLNKAQKGRMDKLCVKFGFEFDINPNTVRDYANFIRRMSPVERADTGIFLGAIHADPFVKFSRAVEDSVSELSFQELHVRLISRLRNSVLIK